MIVLKGVWITGRFSTCSGVAFKG